MSSHIENARRAANNGKAAPNTNGLGSQKAAEARQAFEDQQKKNSNR